MTPYTFGSEIGTRLDIALKVKLNKDTRLSHGKSLVIPMTYKMNQNDSFQVSY